MQKTLTSFFFALSLLCGVRQSQAITIGFEPSLQIVELGSQATVHLSISELGSGVAPSLGTFDLDISYDPSILSFGAVTFGDPILGDQLDLFGLGSIAAFDGGTAGVVNVFELSLDLPSDTDLLQASDFILASLVFAGAGVGHSSLHVYSNAIGDSQGEPLNTSFASGGISTSITPVPEPATIWLAVWALVGALIGRKWQRSRGADPADAEGRKNLI